MRASHTLSTNNLSSTNTMSWISYQGGWQSSITWMPFEYPPPTLLVSHSQTQPTTKEGCGQLPTLASVHQDHQAPSKLVNEFIQLAYWESIFINILLLIINIIGSSYGIGLTFMIILWSCHIISISFAELNFLQYSPSKKPLEMSTETEFKFARVL